MKIFQIIKSLDYKEQNKKIVCYKHIKGNREMDAPERFCKGRQLLPQKVLLSI